MRGPSRAGGSSAQQQNRSSTPYGQNHAGSAIPRPVLESNHAAAGSEVGSASVSVSRQKQSKRDEVRDPDPYLSPPLAPFRSQDAI